jgi:hypothetical protein
MRLVIFGLLLSSTSVFAQSNSSCLPPWTALQIIETFDGSRDYDFTHVLETENASGRSPTRVVVDGHYSAQTHQLSMNAHFDDKFNGVSLPYDLYSVLVVESGDVAGWQDFTKGCTGPGVGFYPGQNFPIPYSKLKGTGKVSIQIMIWGMLN